MLLVAACSGSASGVPTPQGLTAREGNVFDEVVLSWTLACDDCSLEVEYGVAGQSWIVGGGPIAPGDWDGLLRFSPVTPELLEFSFRLRARRGDAASPWSEPAPYRRGVRPPLFSSAVAAGEEVRLEWTNGSQVASAIVLERSAGITGPWTTLTTDIAATSFTEVGAAEGRNVYRVRYGAAGVWSKDAVTATQVPPRAPGDVLATVGPEGVTVTWTRRSAIATSQQLSCSGCGAPAPLPPEATSYLAPGFPPWPASSYWVEALANLPTAGSSGPSPVATLPPFEVAGEAGTFLASAQPYPDDLRARDADGAWYDWSYETGGVQVTRHHASGDTTRLLPATFCVGLAPDGAGNPHVVVEEQPDASTTILAHHWHDASGWHEERTAPLPTRSAGITFRVQAAGTVELAYIALVDGQPERLRHATMVAGLASWTEIPNLVPDAWPNLAVAADGWLHVLGWSSSAPALASKAPGGDWVVEPAPFAYAAIVPSSGGDLAAWGVDSLVGSDRPALFAERIAGTWGATEVVTTIAMTTAPSAARSADGTRWAMTCEVADPNPTGRRTDLFVRGPGGWSSVQLTNRAASLVPRFRPNGQLVVGFGAVLFEEL